MKRLVSTARTERVEFAKSQSALTWTPEYQPVNIVPPSKTPDAVVERWTRVSYPMIAKVRSRAYVAVSMHEKTHVALVESLA